MKIFLEKAWFGGRRSTGERGRMISQHCRTIQAGRDPGELLSNLLLLEGQLWITLGCAGLETSKDGGCSLLPWPSRDRFPSVNFCLEIRSKCDQWWPLRQFSCCEGAGMHSFGFWRDFVCCACSVLGECLSACPNGAAPDDVKYLWEESVGCLGRQQTENLAGVAPTACSAWGNTGQVSYLVTIWFLFICFLFIAKMQPRTENAPRSQL